MLPVVRSPKLIAGSMRRVCHSWCRNPSLSGTVPLRQASPPEADPSARARCEHAQNLILYLRAGIGQELHAARRLRGELRWSVELLPAGGILR